MLSRSAFC